nr:hypothetical protein HmN_000083300 [Hymenolepis microstoma]
MCHFAQHFLRLCHTIVTGVSCKRLASVAHTRVCNKSRNMFGSPLKVSAATFCISIPTFLIVEAYGESNVSRRLVNLPYIALQIGLLAPFFALIIYYSFTTPVSPRKGRKDFIPFYAKIADHGTMYFLVANLITGGLNFSFDSLVFLDMKPVWFSNLCQFLLLSIYTGICPLLAEWLSGLIFRRGRIIDKKSM